VQCVGVRLAGDLIENLDEGGNKIVGETILILLNDYREHLDFTLPPHQADRHWERLENPADPAAETSFHQGKEAYDLQGRSVVVFRLRSRHEEAGKALSADPAETLVDQVMPGRRR
jgi:glycogen operon protein